MKPVDLPSSDDLRSIASEARASKARLEEQRAALRAEAEARLDAENRRQAAAIVAAAGAEMRMAAQRGDTRLAVWRVKSGDASVYEGDQRLTYADLRGVARYVWDLFQEHGYTPYFKWDDGVGISSWNDIMISWE